MPRVTKSKQLANFSVAVDIGFSQSVLNEIQRRDEEEGEEKTESSKWINLPSRRTKEKFKKNWICPQSINLVHSSLCLCCCYLPTCFFFFSFSNSFSFPFICFCWACFFSQLTWSCSSQQHQYDNKAAVINLEEKKKRNERRNTRGKSETEEQFEGRRITELSFQIEAYFTHKYTPIYLIRYSNSNNIYTTWLKSAS